jgi:hypothetical protein
MPARGAKLWLNNTSVLVSSDQSVLKFYLDEPIIKVVFPRAIKPTAIIKTISMMIKITPYDPTFKNIPKSFLLQIITKIMNRIKAV